MGTDRAAPRLYARVGGPSRRAPNRLCSKVETVFEWATGQVRVVEVLIAPVVFLATLAYSGLVEHRRDLRLPMERTDWERWGN